MSDLFTNKIENAEEVFTDIPQPQKKESSVDIPTNDDKFTNNITNNAQIKFDENFNIAPDTTSNAPQQTEKPTNKKGIKLPKGNKKTSKDNSGDFVEPTFDDSANKKKSWTKYIKWVVIGLIVIFIVSKFIKAKSNQNKPQDNTQTQQTSSTEQKNTEPITVQDNYDSFMTVLASGKADFVTGFDFSNKNTYPTQTGAVVSYTDIVKSESIISQNAYTNLTKNGKKEVLNDMFMFSKALCETDVFSDSYDDQLIKDISGLSFIDTNTLNSVLEENGRMVELDTQTTSNYDAEVQIYDSAKKIYDENGSKCMIVGAFCSVDDNKVATLTLLMQDEGNVLKVPVKIIQETKLERDNKLDNLNNGFTQFAYSAKIENLEIGKKYMIQAQTASDDKSYREIGSLIINERE